MTLFNFQLRPLSEIKPWGKAPDSHLSWFGLTDGWYWIDTGDAELFRYSPSIIQHWQRIGNWKSGPSSDLDIYVDYDVVRLWEDILDLLPAVLEPIPAQVAARLTPQAEWDKWYKGFYLKWEGEGDECSDETTDLYLDSIRWWQDRSLDTSYLKAGCRIWFWTDGTDLVVDWDNRGLEIDGIEAWSAKRGRSRMSLQSFMDALTAFDARLMEAVTSRINTIKADWPRPDIAVDLDSLEKEHGTRTRRLAQTLEKVKTRLPTHWNYVIERLHRVEAR